MTFVTVAVILSVVFVVLTLEVRSRVRAAEIGRLSLTERIFTTLEARRQQEQLATIAIVAENPTLKAALDTYFAESSFSDLPADHAASLRETVTVEAEKLATLTGADVVAVLDATGRVFASAGVSRDHWSLGELIEAAVERLVYVRGCRRAIERDLPLRRRAAATWSIATSGRS